MPNFLRHQLVIAAAVGGLLAGLLGFVALAGPGDPLGPSGLDATDTPEATETPDLEPQGNGEATGVPTDSPACEGDTTEDPNPHDTDGDGDGCREVDGKNLPDPAADAQEGTPGLIGNHGEDNDGLGPPDHALTPGPPEGDPPFGHGGDED